LGNVTLTDDDIVIVNNIEAIRNISSNIARQSPYVLQDYMIRRFLKSQAFHMPKRFRTFFNGLTTAISDIHDEEPRTIACAKYVHKNMEFAVFKLYIKKYFDKLARNEVCIIKLDVISISSTYL